MFISVNWIKDFVNLDGVDVDKLIYNFTMSTAEVEQIIKYGYDTCGVVVGQIVDVQNVENSDKLHKVLVDIGDKKVVSICGAKNARVGLKVAFAPVGSRVKGLTVEETKLNSLDSFGICLSEKELGFSDDHSGLMELDEGLKIGQNIKEIIPLEDTIFEIDNKSLTNRPDLWSHYGMAREIAAITKRELKNLDVDDLELYNSLPQFDIKVSNSEECYRYSGIVVENITKKVSPYVMKMRLYYAGIRSINLLADLTNYVMLEIGQPLHAFDKRFIQNVEVSSLREDSSFTTLDGVERNLPKGTLMIRNGSTPVAIAGIMGGLNSEIKDDTTSVFLESASFDSTLIRKSAISIGLRTDAAARYEKTLDPEFVKLASGRFVKLLKDIDNGAKVVSKYSDVYLKKYPKITIDITKEYFDRYIGIDIKIEKIVETLKFLKFDVEQNGNNLKVSVPSFRATKDISLKADLVEEVARIYGYDNIMPKPSLFEAVPQNLDDSHVLEYDAKRILAEKFGADEIHSYVWYNNEKNKMLGINVEDNIKVVNSINKGDDTLRAYMAPTLLYAADNNLRYFSSCKLFEVGRTFSYNFDGKEAKESKILGICLASLKSNYEELMLEAKNMIDSVLKIEKNLEVEYVLNNNNINYSWINKVNTYIIKIEGKDIGYLSLVHPKVAENINKKANIVVVELNLDIINEVATKNIKFSESTKYQTVNLDITAIVDQKTQFVDIKNVIKEAKTKYLLGYELVDIYENAEKLFGKKSVTLRFSIGSYEKTLSKEEIDFDLNALIENFEKANMVVNK